MGDIVVCRICLATEVKMFDLQIYPLETYFEPIIGVNPLCLVELPSYACFECAALVKKYYYFREKCMKGQSLLYNILNENGQITLESIQGIDRNKLKLSTNLQLHINEVCSNIDAMPVKKETNEDTLYEVDCITTFDVKEVKIEDVNVDYPSQNSNSTSSDDEPLSLHKTVKQQNVVRKKKIKRNVKKSVEEDSICEEFLEDNGTDDTSELPEIALPADLLLSTKHKAKRGRPKKAEVKEEEPKSKVRRTKNTGGVAPDEIDIEEYVTVIKLSTEEQLEEIERRKQASNYLNSRFRCELCYKGFVDTAAWKNHIEKHKPVAGDVECQICKFRFKTKRALQKHASNHEKKYACKSCPYVSKTTTQAKQHQRWHKGVTYKCQYCDEVSTKWTSYLSHVRIKHPSSFICGSCGYSFVSQLGLAMHRTMMHKIENKTSDDTAKSGPYCEPCGVQFDTEEAFKRHMVTSVKHSRTNDFSNGCRVCGGTFKNAEDLRIHHRKEHARKRPKNYGKKPSNMAWPRKCEHCSEDIPNAREYWAHFRRAHPDKKYPIQKSYICEICGKSFRGNAFLVYHKRTHFEERAYKCNLCPKAFFNRTNLQMHEKTHSEHRPYPCSACFKAFKCKGALDRHFRSHTGVKPYECEFCGKAFGQSNSRKLHVRTVHLKQPAPYVSRSRLERKRAVQSATTDITQEQFVCYSHTQSHSLN